MEIGRKIRNYRIKFNITQEDLAEKLMVSRQSISNWENGKFYPDINTLIKISEIFEVSLDNLVKGDLDMMRKKVVCKNEEKVDLKVFSKYSIIYSIILFAIIILPYPMFYFFNRINAFYYGLTLYAFIFIIGLYCAIKIEILKKKYDMQTYREVLAFVEGKNLKENEKWKEIGKRGYQKIVDSLA